MTGVAADGALLYAVFFAGARQRQSVDDLPGDRLHVHSGGRRRRAGARRTAQRDASRWGSASACWSVASRTPCFRIRRRRPRRPAPRPSRPRSRKLERPAGHAGRHARVRAGADQPGLLSRRHHEDGRARPAGRRHQRAFGRTRAGRIHADGRIDGDGGLVRPVAAAEPVDADAVDHGGGALGGRGCSASGPRSCRRRSGSTP